MAFLSLRQASSSLPTPQPCRCPYLQCCVAAAQVVQAAHIDELLLHTAQHTGLHITHVQLKVNCSTSTTGQHSKRQGGHSNQITASQALLSRVGQLPSHKEGREVACHKETCFGIDAQTKWCPKSTHNSFMTAELPPDRHIRGLQLPRQDRSQI